MNQARPAAVEAGQTSTLVSVSLGLSALVLIIYAQSYWFTFVNYDDDTYVFGNPHITDGLTISNVAWAFTSKHSHNWHPLTSMSHMLDVQLFGLEPGMHHVVNMLLHAATAVTLFFALRHLTGQLWPCGFVAAIFAAHPLRVESVAWVAERKDVLSGFFFALTLWAYADYVRCPSFRRYALTGIALALGLLAKPILVTVPCVLLLLDYWPLQRFSQNDGGRRRTVTLVLEKLPFLALAVASSAATIWAQTAAFTVLRAVSMTDRLANALVSYTVYIRQTFWPCNLAVYYPHSRGKLSLAEVIAAGFLLLTVTAAAVALRRRRPYLVVGWLWYLGMLVPVIGIIQVGSQAHADRYTYLPQIGLTIGLTWLAVDLSGRWKNRQLVLSWAAATVLLVLTGLSWLQARHWRNSMTLFQHALEVTSDNVVAHQNLGSTLIAQGRYEEAADHCQQALAIQPNNDGVLYGYGVTLFQLGRYEESKEYLLRALEANESLAPVVTMDLGVLHGRIEQFDEAERWFTQALELEPGRAVTHHSIGILRVKQKRYREAADCFREAVRLEPTAGNFRNDLAFALYKSDRPAEAMDVLRETIRQQPDDVLALRLAARIASSSEDIRLRSLEEAVNWSERASALTEGRVPLFLDQLAVSYAAAGRLEEAIRVGTRALDLATDRESPETVAQLRAHLEQYRSGSVPQLPASELD